MNQVERTKFISTAVGQAALADGAKLVQASVSNEMLNGEVIRLDGAIRLAPK